MEAEAPSERAEVDCLQNLGAFLPISFKEAFEVARPLLGHLSDLVDEIEERYREVLLDGCHHCNCKKSVTLSHWCGI